MANEISYSTSLSCYKAGVTSSPIGRAVTGLQANMNLDVYAQGTALIGITATAFPPGQLSQLSWAWFNNLDPTNYFQLSNGPTGAVVCRFLAGYGAWIPLDYNCVPYGIANTAPVSVEYLILSM